MSTYHWVIDQAGKVTDIPDEEQDDEVDALRYLCQNLFGPKGRPLVASVNHTTLTQEGDSIVSKRNDWMTNKIRELTDGNSQGTVIKGKKGSFIFEV
jgi:hypothetical protein